MATLRLSLICSPALLMVGCLISRLDTDGPSQSGDAGATNGGTNLVAGESAGGRDANGGDTAKGGSAGTDVGGTTGGTLGSGGSAGTTDSGGSAGADGGTTAGGSTTGGTSGTAGEASAGEGGGGPVIVDPRDDITMVWKSDGCGKAAPAAGAGTIQTMGVKDANCAATVANGDPRCGAWGQPASDWQKTTLPRGYHLYLPSAHSNSKAYPLVLLGPGCGGNATQTYTLDSNANETVIRVGLTPANTTIVGHGTNPGQGCFDDKEGDDSLDWVFYENLYDKLNQELCFDRNRVFAGGNSSGSFFANELGCKYAGDGERPVRGIIANTGGLPTEPQYKPTCTAKPMSGLWVHETADTTQPFTGTKAAINRAMAVNGCLPSTASYDTATQVSYPVPGRPAAECKKIAGCPDLYPLIVCELPGNGHGSHEVTVNPTASLYLQNFLKAPLLTP